MLRKLFKKNKTIEVKRIDKLSLRLLFDVKYFNRWFQYEYDGYGGYKGGARGIFLRVDKLSDSMIDDYFNSQGHPDMAPKARHEFRNDIINDWFRRREEQNKEK